MAKQPIIVDSFDLTCEQQTRMAHALAIFDAKRAALQRGKSLAEVQAQAWLVHVDAVEARAV